ncbi:MAG: phosphoglycerate kinase, partial [Patescibacteria group bacterium]
DFENKKVLVRVDWNLPTDEAGVILDASRIEVSLPTIEYIKNHNGIPIIASHFGREGESIEPVMTYAKKNYPILATGVEFLENLRQNSGEETNSEEFAKELASKAEFYVNEAFSTSHREHASIISVPKLLPSFAGLRFLEEFEKLSTAFNPEHPFLLILGGAKFETKLPLVKKFLNIADYIFIGGALAKEAMEMEISKNPKIILPVGDLAALDANEETLEILKSKIENSKFVLWNGPLGKYEEGYKEGTLKLAQILANSNAKVIVGGGDTENVIDELNISHKFFFVSLAGSAMLEFLANGTLPGIEALNQTPS